MSGSAVPPEDPDAEALRLLVRVRETWEWVETLGSTGLQRLDRETGFVILPDGYLDAVRDHLEALSAFDAYVRKRG